MGQRHISDGQQGTAETTLPENTEEMPSGGEAAAELLAAGPDPCCLLDAVDGRFSMLFNLFI